ncbi:hypothetical protein EON79_06260 [bacterium]|nr:MAG: hypothetical protein EON79_06260 [bacterium]
MAVSLDELFDLRDNLIALASQPPLDHSPETIDRLITARTYYCVYHYGLDIALANGYVVPSGGSVHQALWAYFKNRQLPKYKKIGHWGHDLHVFRGNADYDIHIPFGAIRKDAVALSADIMDRLNQFDADIASNKQ